MTAFEQQGRTDQLETVLQAIETSQQTGTMNVERGKGGVRDTGNIVFLYGQPVEASAGGRTGIEALDWLKTWGTCRYVFTPQQPSEIKITLPVPTPKPSPGSVPTSPLSLITQIVPGLSQILARNNTVPDEHTKTDDNVAPQVAEMPTGPMQVPSGMPPVVPPALPAPPALPPAPYSLPPAQSPTFQPSPYVDFNYQPPQLPTNGAHTDSFASRDPIISRAPYRLLEGTAAIALMQQMRLSRLHRHVFFLLDGQRTIKDIARLTGHSLAEVQYLLADLEQLGLIRQES